MLLSRVVSGAYVRCAVGKTVRLAAFAKVCQKKRHASFPNVLHLQMPEFPLFPFLSPVCRTSRYAHSFTGRGAARLLDPFLQKISAFGPDRAAGRRCNFTRSDSRDSPDEHQSGLEPEVTLGRTQNTPLKICLILCRRSSHSGYTRTRLLTL